MRVISGHFKGKPLKSPISYNVRPTGDKVKQALFTKLQFFLQDATVLDLFSGSGALGIEALSRGAKFVYFVDKSSQSIALTKSNLSTLNCSNYKVINADYKTALCKFNQAFDLILVDPPYESGYYNNILSLIEQNNMLSRGGYVVCEHPAGMQLSTNLTLVDKKRYGTVELSYYQLN